jgi:hypothetical protein
MVAAKVRSANWQTGEAAAAAAELLNVSTRNVYSAAKVREAGTPELVEAVERGKVAVSTAAEIARVERERELRTAGYVRA